MHHVNIEDLINLKQVLFMKENGKVHLEMDMVNKYGQMELNMLEIGNRIELMERVNSFISMGMCMMENGKRIKQMDMVCTCM